MTRYALVENGVVKGTMGLPKNTKNVSGLNKMKKEKLKDYGYLPYEYTAPAFNPLTQKLGDIEFTILKDKVVGTNAVINLVKKETDAIKESFINSIKLLIIESLYHTDWVYLADSGLSSAEQKAYTDLRASMKSALAGMSGFTPAKLKELIEKLEQCKEAMCQRLTVFSAEMVLLQSFLA